MLSGGCGGARDVDPVVRVVLSSALGCRPSRIDSARVEVWGDFPLRDENVVVVEEGGALHLPTVPAASRVIAVELEGDMVVSGLSALPAPNAEATLLALPLGVSCPVPDPEFHDHVGAAMAVMEDGTLVLVGGLDDTGVGLRRVIALGPATELGELGRPLILGLAYASVTPTGPREVLVAGGSDRQDGTARDIFERVGLDEDESAPRRTGFLAAARREHAALRLRSGEVLLVGGRDEDFLSSVERIGEEAVNGVTVTARLRVPRAGATLVERRDGSVVVAGGIGEAGPVATLEVLSASLDLSTTVDLSLPPPHAVVPLPYARLLWLGMDGSARVVLLDAEGGLVAVPLVSALPLGPVVGTPSGSILVHDAAARQLVVIDRQGRTTRVPSSRATTLLAALPDGTVVEIDGSGASRLREGMLSEVAPPPATYQFPIDRGLVVLDAGSRFVDVAGALRAGPTGGALAVPVLSFRDFRTTLRVGALAEGRLTLRLTPGDAGLRITSERAMGWGCDVARAEGAPVVVERRADRFAVDAGAGRVECSDGPHERASIALELSAGVELASIALERL